jgi:hypothetical protein
MNLQSVKILLKNNENEEADSLFKSFMEMGEKNEFFIHELQQLNYQLMLGDSYSKELKWGRALRQYMFNFENISEFAED